MDTTGKASKREKVKRKRDKKIELTPLHMEIIKELQKDIEIVK